MFYYFQTMLNFDLCQIQSEERITSKKDLTVTTLGGPKSKNVSEFSVSILCTTLGLCVASIRPTVFNAAI